MTGSETLQFYWRPGCPFCVTLRRGLQRRGIPFEPINETVPTVFVGERSLVNPSVAQVESLIREAAPSLAAALESQTGRRRWWQRRTAAT
jgi:hypothetical protein